MTANLNGLPCPSEVTIQRCANFISNGQGNFRQEDKETQAIRRVYIKYKNLFRLQKIKSDNQPIEKFSVQMITALHNHYTMNFDKFQFMYLQSKLRYHFYCYMGLDFKYLANLHNYLTRRCQSAINSNSLLEIKLDETRPENKNINKEELYKILNIFVRDEKILIPLALSGSLRATTAKKIKMRNKKIINNLWSAISYHRYMLKHLESLNLKRFDLIPHRHLSLNCVSLGSRFLSRIINEKDKN